MEILDSTLRDGEQMPNVVFTSTQKIHLAKVIFDFGIDYIDLMPAVSKEEIYVAETLVDSGFGKRIFASALMKKEQIDLCKSLGLEKIILISPLSDIHLEKKLGISRSKNLTNALRYLEYAKEKNLGVGFAGEDSTRADENYLIDFVNSLGDRVDCFYFCDTLGILTPRKTEESIKKLKSETDCKIGLHFHNDFGQATANTLAGIEAGADTFSGTFMGIGERAGNASIEEVVTALRFQDGLSLPLKYEKLWKVCRLVEEYSGVSLPYNKAISGKNAFSHQSGVHVDGVLKFPLNYENFEPELIGRKREIFFGKHSGKRSLKYLFGGRFSDEEYSKILEEIKSRAEAEKRFFSEEEIRKFFEDRI